MLLAKMKLIESLIAAEEPFGILFVTEQMSACKGLEVFGNGDGTAISDEMRNWTTER